MARPQTPKRHSYKEVVGKHVRFPGSYFGVNVPGLFYEAHVQKKDPSRTGYVIVACKGDSSRYFIPVEVSTPMTDGCGKRLQSTDALLLR